jgi:hypothetical protein
MKLFRMVILSISCDDAEKNDFFGYFRRLEKYFFRIFEKNDLNFFFYKNNVFNISENKIPMMKASVVDLKCDLPTHGTTTRGSIRIRFSSRPCVFSMEMARQNQNGNSSQRTLRK